MTDIEHAKKYAEESISLAISMYNPKAEIIAETACLYGLTYKNEQIAKLEKENVELKKKCYKKAVKDYCKLEKENAELKEKLKPENCLKLLAKEGYIKFTSEQLTKAKEIIKKVAKMYRYSPRVEEIIEQAEQFLSEVEK